MKDYDVNRLLEKRRLKTGRGDDALYNFYEKVERAVLLVNFSEDSNSRKIKSESRRQFIISLVTAMEVYLTDLITYLIDNENIKLEKLNLPSHQFTISNIIQIQKSKITVGELISMYTNFQNLDDINQLLSKLFDVKFFDFLKTRTFTFQNTSGKLTKIHPKQDYYKKLNIIIKNRHKFVHDLSFNQTPKCSYLSNSRDVMYDFVHCIEILANKLKRTRPGCNIL